MSLREKWIAALRSGKYKQATGQLRINGSMCCLGVACDIAQPDGWRLDMKGEYVHQFSAPHDRRGMIGETLRDLLGITHTTAISLTHRNDSGSTFDEIADWLESQSMPRRYEVEVTLEGFTYDCKFTVGPAEPDVGIMGEYVDELQVEPEVDDSTFDIILAIIEDNHLPYEDEGEYND